MYEELIKMEVTVNGCPDIGIVAQIEYNKGITVVYKKDTSRILLCISKEAAIKATSEKQYKKDFEQLVDDIRSKRSVNLFQTEGIPQAALQDMCPFNGGADA